MARYWLAVDSCFWVRRWLSQSLSDNSLRKNSCKDSNASFPFK
jgi:hypothetical protein